MTTTNVCITSSDHSLPACEYIKTDIFHNSSLHSHQHNLSANTSTILSSNVIFIPFTIRGWLCHWRLLHSLSLQYQVMQTRPLSWPQKPCHFCCQHLSVPSQRLCHKVLQSLFFWEKKTRNTYSRVYLWRQLEFLLIWIIKDSVSF